MKIIYASVLCLLMISCINKIPPASDYIILVTVDQLYKDFMADEKAALRKYENKTLQIIGTVTEYSFPWEKSSGTLSFAFLDIEKDKMAIICNLVGRPMGKTTNDEIVIQGKFSKYTVREDMQYKFILIEDSQLVLPVVSTN